MIKLTLKNGQPVYVNPERVLAVGPGVTGPVSFAIRETPEQVACAILLWRATNKGAK